MMESWRDNILAQFVPQVSKLSLVADPDNLLTEEVMVTALRQKGFDILEFNDAIEFRFAYESQYRAAWDSGATTDLVVILHVKDASLDNLPYDLLEAGRKFYFSLADIFPTLSPPVLDRLDRAMLDELYAARQHLPKERVGDNATIDAILRYVYKIDADLITSETDLLRTLLRLHYNNFCLDSSYIDRLLYLLKEKSAFKPLPLENLLRDREEFFSFLIEEHRPFLEQSPEVVLVKEIYSVEPASSRLTEKLFQGFEHEMPGASSTHSEWTAFALKYAHLASLVYRSNKKTERERLDALLETCNAAFSEWLFARYSSLITQPPIVPAMVHHIPRHFTHVFDAQKQNLALIVIDGFSLDQWITLRDALQYSLLPAGYPDTSPACWNQAQPYFTFKENAVFAWIPTLTAVSRQALFSGKKPFEFAESINTTAKEASLWSLFWENVGFAKNQIAYQKGLGDGAPDEILDHLIIPGKTKIAGLVINKIDDIMHGEQLGMAGMHSQIALYAQNGFLSGLFDALLRRNFDVYLTSDHGNIECYGTGRPNEASIAQTRGERAMVYKSAELRQTIAGAFPAGVVWPPVGLPPEYFPLLANGTSAFLRNGETAVSHGSFSIQEALVPFVKIERKSAA